MNKTAKNNPITVSKRNVHILLTLSRGPITLDDLKKRCFKKDPNLDYKSYKKDQDRLAIQARDADPYVSRQFIDRKLATIEKRGLIGAAEYFQITTNGMPLRTKVYYLTEDGYHHVCRSFGVHKHDIRYGKPLNLHMEHELNISKIALKLYDDAESGQYQVSFVHADRALRSIFSLKIGSLPSKGMHFLDLQVRIQRNNGDEMDIPIELANIKDDPDFWKNKIHEIQETFFILTKNNDFVKMICAWIQEIKLDHPMYVASLQDFLRMGVKNTVWEKVSSGKIEKVRINLDSQHQPVIPPTRELRA